MIERGEIGIVKTTAATHDFLEEWLDDVILHWTDEWKDRTDGHPYTRLATFLGERFLTDFNFREVERTAKR